MGGLIEFTSGAALFHICLHCHGFSQGAIEVIVIDVVEHFVLPTEIESANVALLEQIVAIVGIRFVESVLVVLIEGDANFLQQSAGCIVFHLSSPRCHEDYRH